MGRKLTNVYKVLVRGVGQGLSGHDLYDFVSQNSADFSDKRVCRAALLAISDPLIKDRDILERIYTIATNHRVRCAA
ncbi:hypothetical protein [Neorhizobium sp. NCHU2750]|uniref:hypothetical protein n=1 Tax=Neorhizobium sp. NCHU2750 TaxID=1825976 RepID=UPI000E755EF7